MDATKRPVKIPVEFTTYAEQHGVFEMFKDMMEELLIYKPDSPLPFLKDYLTREGTFLPSVVILGPPASGKCTISRLIATKIRAIHLTDQNMLSEVSDSLREAAMSYTNNGKEIPPALWVEILQERLKMFDVMRRGYVLDGFPHTREQAVALQTAGISPRHCVILEAPDTVLIERADGKRIDVETGDVYHTTFDWPANPDIQNRLTDVLGYTEAYLKSALAEYHHNIPGIIESYRTVLKTINADQPKPDVFAQVYQFVTSKARSLAPFTPRILLLGPTGAGKAVQAALLSNKYNIVNVSSDHLIKEAMENKGKVGTMVKTYMDRGMSPPDNIVMDLIKARLSQKDCLTSGWVLYGFPLNTDQAGQLRSVGYEPNRVFFLEVPNDSIIERLMLRMTDPVTGDRYHLLYNPPRMAEVRERLQRHPNDEEEAVRRRLMHYQTYKEDLEDYYVDALHINGDQDPHTVFETIESMTVNPLPKQYDV